MSYQLADGERIGPYEIGAPIGRGGMGEIYRSRDTRLGRAVAIKVITGAGAVDQQRRERFYQEARAISSLNHPNICTVYDVGEHAGLPFLAMELLEGETLAVRLKRGPLAIAEVIEFGIRIADALAEAHRHALVHRDVKPGNVMLTRSGVKLLDFGLAKSRRDSGPMALTTGARELTSPGAVLGTWAYMSPEQAQGLQVDHRTDIFALGAVMYEMLTGRQAFDGTNEALLINAVLSSQPTPPSELRADAPAALAQIIESCLNKQVEERWQSAADVSKALRLLSQTAVADRARQSRPTALVIMAAIATVIAAIALTVGWPRLTDGVAPATSMSIFSVDVPPDNRLDYRSPPALSGDGKLLAFPATSLDGRTQLWLRRIDALVSNALRGTDGASYPFWSPDNSSIGFFADGKLKRIPASGGPVTVLADAAVGRGASWSSAARIVFAPTIYDGLFDVAESGGPVQPAVPVIADAPTRKFPFFLPDGKHFLYLSGAGGHEHQSIRIGVLGAVEQDRELFVGVDSAAQYAQGRLVYRHGTAIVARAFDAERLTVTGDEKVVVDPVSEGGANQSWSFTIAPTGTLVYYPPRNSSRQLKWVDRTGRVLSTLDERPGFGSRISPDQTRVAVHLDPTVGSGNEIWTFDLQRGVKSRLTQSPEPFTDAIWSPDGQTLIYSVNRSGRYDLYKKRADGSSGEELLYADNLLKLAGSVSPDGSLLVYTARSDAKTGDDVWVLPQPLASKPLKPYAFRATAINERNPRFSPDGRWVAFESDAGPGPEVVVVSATGAGPTQQISSEGGSRPVWGKDGHELFFLSADGRLMAATYSVVGSTFEVRRVDALFQTSAQNFDVARDGKRLLMWVPTAPAREPSLVVVQNWIASQNMRD